MDVLTELLYRAHARGSLFSHFVLRAPWGLAFDSLVPPPAGVHAILSGSAVLRLADGTVSPLAAGDVVLVRGRVWHALVDGPDTEPASVDEAMRRWRDPEHARRHRNHGARTGRETEIACGAYQLEGGICDRLLEALPPVVVLPAGAGPQGAAVRGLLGMLADELAGHSPGQQTVLDRVLDLLLVFVLRAWFARPEGVAPAWYRALGDPVVGPALRRLHESPATAWTVGRLAAEAGASRAAFARRFSSTVGVTPLAYLTGWRMDLAAERLRSAQATLAQIAQEVGYASEFAFSAAFKRHTGEAPAHYRRRHAASSGQSGATAPAPVGGAG